MRTISDIEEQAAKLNKRMSEIYDELRAEPERASELAEELANLLHEAKILHCSLRYYQEMTVELLNSDCSGPH